MISHFLRKEYHSLNQINISRSALATNFQVLSQLQPNSAICPVLKSNAYGHGLSQVGPMFDSFQPAFLVVDSLYEAYELRKLRVKSPILIMGYTDPRNFAVKELGFEYAVYDLEMVRALSRYQRHSRVHLFVDTGMHREGIPLPDLRSFTTEVKKLNNIEIVGVCSHFADADNPKDTSWMKKQMANFLEAINIVETEGVHLHWKHLAASAGTLKLQHPKLNMFRVGLASYGICPLEPTDPFFEQVKLSPALSLHSHIVQIKEIQKGDRVGYNGTFEAKKRMNIALLPLGYYEGVDRRLSNQGWVKVGKEFCPIIGRVSMNMTTIDVTHVEYVYVGQPVTVYSSDASDKNSLAGAALLAKTIPYELITKLAESVKRVIVE